MWVIAVYDAAVERNAKVLRTCRRYLHWAQNSVFEGELTDGQLARLKAELDTVIDPSHDRIRVYTIASPDWVRTHHWGNDKEEDRQIL